MSAVHVAIERNSQGPLVLQSTFNTRRRGSTRVRPACTPSAIRAVLAANTDAAVLQRYGAELDVAHEQARDDGDIAALVKTVRRRWARKS